MRRSVVTTIRSSTFLILLACGRQPPPGERANNQPSASADSAPGQPLAVDTPATRPTIRPGSPARGTADQRPIVVPQKKREPILSIGELLRDPSLAGTLVAVRGNCLRSGMGQAQGEPPLTRSDWEFGDGDQAVWVSGPRPPDCPVETGGTVRSVARGLVRVDTLRMFDGTQRPRVYIVVDHSR